MLGRDDIGALKPGMAADFISFGMHQLPFAGALHDPVAALLLCASVNVSTSVINGRIVVRDGHFTQLELEPLIERHNTIARALANGEAY